MSMASRTADWVHDARRRRLLYVAAALLAAVLVFFPRPYVARAKIVPQDTSASAASTTSLLGALGSGSQSIGSLLTGGRPSNDLYLVIGRSDTVKHDVITALKLVGPDAPFASERDAMLWLDRKVDIHLLLGGVMEIETKLYDAAEAYRITVAYANAIGANLARFGRQIITNKKLILRQRYANSRQRVAEAEAALNAFRRQNNLADPESQLGAGLSSRVRLESELQAKQVEYATQSQIRGPEAVELAQLRTEIAALRVQIARTTTPAVTSTGPNIAGLTAIQLRYLTLFRDLNSQIAILNVYQRSSEQVEVEELAAESASYIQIIDPAGIAPERQHNVWAIAALAGIALLALFTEWYAPATGLTLRPRTVDPVDERRAAIPLSEGLEAKS